jgi:hypoxanthine phosphoribosyltransferase
MSDASRRQEIRFAHPLEREVALVFDHHRIPWRYEETTFVLARDREGRVTAALTPDFYLPDQDLYIECTTMRQSLTWRKRHKVREARRLYGVLIEILYLRDALRLAERWGLDGLARATTSSA